MGRYTLSQSERESSSSSRCWDFAAAAAPSGSSTRSSRDIETEEAAIFVWDMNCLRFKQDCICICFCFCFCFCWCVIVQLGGFSFRIRSCSLTCNRFFAILSFSVLTAPTSLARSLIQYNTIILFLSTFYSIG